MTPPGDINPGPGGSSPTNPAPFGAGVVFGACSATGDAAVAGGKLSFGIYDFFSAEPWVSDGTSVGTQLVRNFPTPLLTKEMEFLGDVNARLVLVPPAIIADDDLWTSDGTAPGTVKIEEFGTQPRGSGCFDGFASNGSLGAS